MATTKSKARKAAATAGAPTSERPSRTKRQTAALEFGELASRWQVFANRATGDSDARELTAILWALKAAYAGSDPWLDGIARKARAYLKKHNTGPRARPAEADQLAAHVGQALHDGHPVAEIALRLLRRLHALPAICAETSVPISGEWTESDRTTAAERVAKALEPLHARSEKDPELWVKAALKAIGHGATKNMFAHVKG